jgi:hypothetical protein
MNTFKFRLLTLSSIVLLGCAGVPEVDINNISATSNSSIVEEYFYGDDGGKFSIYQSCLSSDERRIGFYGYAGFDEYGECLVGELSTDGSLLWQEYVPNDYVSRILTDANGGYFFYGQKQITEGKYAAFLYFLSSERKQAIEIQMPKPNSYDINQIHHIENLGNNEYLFYIYCGDYYYYTKFTFASNTLQQTSEWIASDYYLNICAVNQAGDGSYEIYGNSLYNNTDTMWMYAREIKLTANSASLVVNRALWYFHYDSDFSWFLSGQAYKDGKLYATWYEDNTNFSFSRSKMACYDFNAMTWVWYDKQFDIYPRALVCQGDKILVIDGIVNYTLTESNDAVEYSYSRGYGRVDTYSLNGDYLQTYTFGSNICESGLNHAIVKNSQLYFFGYTDVKYISVSENMNWFLPYNGFKGWFFKVNLSNL